MSNYNSDQSQLFYFQILLSLAFIVNLLISIMLSYNEILKIKNQKRLFDNDIETKILIFNRIFNTLIIIGFVFVNVISKRTNDNQNNNHADLQIDASILSLLSSLIVLYVTLDSINNITNSDFSNPGL